MYLLDSLVFCNKASSLVGSYLFATTNNATNILVVYVVIAITMAVV